MFKPKNALISMAVVALLAACGGGGGGGGDDPGTNPNNNPPPTQPDNQNPAATADTQWTAGTFNLSGPGVIVGTSDTAVAQLPYAEFVRGPENPRGDDTGYGLYGQPVGENAPLESFGLSFSFAATTPGTASTSVGRIAFELADQATGTAQPDQALRILVDKVNYAVDANGNVTATLAADSKLYVYAKNGTSNAVVNTTAADLVRVVQNPGGDDVTRFAIVLDVDKAVGDALAAAPAGSTQAQVLESVKTFSGPLASPFKVSIAYSNLNIDNAGADLVAPTISVTNAGVAGVKDGGGATGYLQVEEQAPATP